jgi:phosphoglycerol transferase MdoB-like AlkP superfamily enzyme
MMNNKAILFYLLMLVAHVAHVFEETWGRFWLMEAVYGLGWFLVANWVLFCIPVALFYFVLHRRRWAYYAGMAYAAIMIANGTGHNLALLLTHRYFGGFAGAYTGVGLVAIGLPLIYYLRQAMPTG